VKLNFLHVMV